MNESVGIDIIEGEFPRPSTSTFEEALANATDFEFANTTSSTTEKPSDLAPVARFIDEHSWVIYLAVAIITIIVAVVVIFIVRTIIKNKKRVIRQENDPVVNHLYQDEAKWCKRICCCCCRTSDHTTRLRQNSASNMDPYRRQPHAIAPQKDTSYIVTTFDGKDLFDSTESDDYGAKIHAGIKGVPHTTAEPPRVLPPLRRFHPPPA